MKLTLKQAAKQTGKSKQAIQQAIKKGKISAKKNESNEWRIDASELFRVYDPVNPVDSKKSSTIDGALQQDLLLKVKELELESKIKDKEILFLEKRAGDLEQERDEWRKQAQTLAISDKRAQKKSMRLLERLKIAFGGSLD